MANESELAILNVLWQHGPSTVREVFEVLSRDKEIGYTTVLKLMQIMTEKQLVNRDESSRTHVYEAAYSQEKTQQQLTLDLLERAFAGSASRLVLQALSSKPTSKEELAEIRKLLDTLEKKR
jgi:BlaI family transcriptional regulator, penicillinase repressor